MSGDSGVGEGDDSVAPDEAPKAVSSKRSEAPALPIALLRHISMEPAGPLEPHSITFELVRCKGEHGEALGGGFLVVSGFQLQTVAGNQHRPPGLQLGTVESSDLLRVGDIVVGICGTPTMGMDVAALNRAIEATRAVVPGSCIILHVSPVPITTHEMEEAAVQMAGACALLLGGRGYVEAAMDAVVKALEYSFMPIAFVPSSGNNPPPGLVPNDVQGAASNFPRHYSEEDL